MLSAYRKIFTAAKNGLRSERGLALMLALGLSYFSLIAYIQAAASIFNTWNDWHLDNLHNLAPSPLQYRVLSFLFPHLLAKLFHINIVNAYLWERFFFLFLVGYFLFGFARQWFQVERSALVVVLFFLFYNLTARPHIQPAEEPNIFYFLLAFMLMERSRFWWLLFVCILGAATKQTIVFIVPIYLVYQVLETRRLGWRDVLRTALLTIVIAVVQLGILAYYGSDRPYLGQFWQYEYNLKQLTSGVWPAYNFLFVSLIPMVFIFFSWKKQPTIIQAVALIIPFFTAGHFLISRVEEFRTFMPLALVTLPGFLLIIQSQGWFKPPALPPGRSQTLES